MSRPRKMTVSRVEKPCSLCGLTADVYSVSVTEPMVTKTVVLCKSCIDRIPEFVRVLEVTPAASATGVSVDQDHLDGGVISTEYEGPSRRFGEE